MSSIIRVFFMTILGALIPMPLVFVASSDFPFDTPEHVFNSVVFPCLGCGVLFFLSAFCSVIPPRGTGMLRCLMLVGGTFILSAVLTVPASLNKLDSRTVDPTFPFLAALVVSCILFVAGYRTRKEENGSLSEAVELQADR